VLILPINPDIFPNLFSGASIARSTAFALKLTFRPYCKESTTK
jgi:hypothetical protein